MSSRKQNHNRPEQKRRKQPTTNRIVWAEAEVFTLSPADGSLSFTQIPDEDLAPLIEFFRILDRWDREGQNDTDGD